MATTFADLTNECLSYLTSYGRDLDKVTSLVSTINPSALLVTVLDGNQVDRGLIEINDELMSVSSVDVSTGQVTLHPWGRAVAGTAAASHTSGAMVVCSPAFPRSRVKQEILQSVASLYPDLFDTNTYTATVSPVTVAYSLPADCESVVSVQVQSIGPSKAWTPVSRYRMDRAADTTAFPTGRSLDIYEAMPPGRPLKIVYRRRLGALSADTDTLTSVGVREEWRDIIRMLTVGRILLGLDPARLQLASVEADARSQFVQPLQATQIGRSFIAMANDRVASERRQLLVEFPSSQVRMS